MVDIHCHLSHSPLEKIRDSIVQKCRQLGINYLVNCVTSLNKWESELNIIEPNVLLSLGIHPQSVKDVDYSYWLNQLEKLTNSSRVAAVGEIGFDKYKFNADYSVQEKIFFSQLEIAQNKSLPLVIHCRGHYDKLQNILKQKKITVPLILHRYTGGDGQVNAFAKLGCYFSFSADILNPQNKKTLNSIKATPAELILAETDAPYFHENSKSWGTPCALPQVISVIAEIKNTKNSKMRKIIDENITIAFQERIPV